MTNVFAWIFCITEWKDSVYVGIFTYVLLCALPHTCVKDKNKT